MQLEVRWVRRRSTRSLPDAGRDAQADERLGIKVDA
jgi:hypothetical protein